MALRWSNRRLKRTAFTLYSVPSIILLIMLGKTLRQTRNVSDVKNVINEYKILIVKPEGKDHLKIWT